MHSPQTPTLFQKTPVFSKEPTAEARWDKIAWKLNTFHQAGGQFRDLTVAAFEKSQQYDIRRTENRNNCYSSALGLLVSGDLTVCPGRLALAEKGDDDNLVIHNKARQFTDYHTIGSQLRLFETKLQQGLQSDGIVRDIPLAEVGNYFPIIGLSYNATPETPKTCTLDFHFLVPHIKGYANNAISYMFSGREGLKGPSEYYANEQHMAGSSLSQNCHKADIYFASNAYLGQKVTVTDEDYMARKVLLQKLMSGEHADLVSGLSLGNIFTARKPS